MHGPVHTGSERSNHVALAIRPIGAISEPTKITVQMGAQRHPKDAEAGGWSALDDDSWSAQDRNAGRMAVPARARSAGVTVADRGRAVPGVALVR